MATQYCLNFIGYKWKGALNINNILNNSNYTQNSLLANPYINNTLLGNNGTLLGNTLLGNNGTLLGNTNRQYIKLTKTGKNILESIDIQVEYPYFKIVNLTVYILQLCDLTTYNSNFPEQNITMLKYINNIENKKFISKYNIKITENDKIFTITDNKFNILKLEDIVYSDSEYLATEIKVKYLISNILEKK